MKYKTKLIGGFTHYHRRCVKCREMVWTQDRKIPDYYCKTCVQPKFGETIGRNGPALVGDDQGSLDNGVRALEG